MDTAMTVPGPWLPMPPGRGPLSSSRLPGGSTLRSDDCTLSSSWPISWSRTAIVVAAPASTDTTATSSTAVSTSRDVRERNQGTASRVHGGRLQDVPGAAHGVDHRLPACVDLLAQVGDVELDHVGLAAEVVVPHPVEDLRLRQHPLGVAHQESQQLELGGGQGDLGAGPPYLVGVLVE